MNIEELAREKVMLEMRLLAISETGIYGMSIDDRVKLEMDRIETSKRLVQVCGKIYDYEHE